MDRRRRRSRALGLAAALLGGAALAQDAPIQALRWLAPGADRARLLAAEPAECLQVPADPALARSVEIGRAAFRTPTLLGGQAARAGLSCESCHRAGRGNEAFQFPGVSGPPGTADVTSSLFSSHRGDGTDNPLPIPDLAGPREALKVAPSDVPAFVRGLIVEEFDGPEPPAAVLAGVADYVRALSPTACPATDERPVTVAALMDEVRRALAAARTAPDPATAAAMVAAARARLPQASARTGSSRTARMPSASPCAVAGVSTAVSSVSTWVWVSKRVATIGFDGWLTEQFAMARPTSHWDWLVANGVKFTPDAESPGALHLTREGGHSRRRVVHTADATGHAVQTSLIQQVRAHPDITLFEQHVAIDLISGRLAGGQERQIHGAYALNKATDQVETFSAGHTVLATGGAGKVYLYTTNPDTSTGDGLAMAWRAGCRVANLEFVQFHPTAIDIGRHPAPLGGHADGSTLRSGRAQGLLPSRRS